MFRSTTLVFACALVAGVPVLAAQSAAPAASSSARQTGTVKSAAANSLVMTTTAGQDVTVSVPAEAKVLVVAPGAKDLKSATPGSIADVAAGDRVIATGAGGEAGAPYVATRLILMKSSAIAQAHAADEAAWAQGGGGIVKSVSGSTVVISSGLKTVSVTVTPQTIVRRYSGTSVKFGDAVKSDVSAIAPGDQLRVRGAKSADGTSVTADEVVVGSFRNFSGLLTAVDATAGTVTLKDLKSGKVVTVAVTPSSDVHRLPVPVAQRLAAEMKGGAAGGGAGAAGGRPAAAPGAAPGGQGGAQAGAGARRAGSDLSSMIARMPTETLAGLKVGDAVMIVATSGSAGSAGSTAVTVIAGVDPILTAAPAGEMTISPWSLGGGGDAGGGGQ